MGPIFEESGPREGPCGTPDGRLGLPRHLETSLAWALEGTMGEWRFPLRLPGPLPPLI